MTYFVPTAMALSLLTVCQTAAADKWDEADRAIRRLDPAEFSELPAIIVADLKKRGCTIPQPTNQGKRHNVISGGFARVGQKNSDPKNWAILQTDWAVLCSRNRTSSILIYWAGMRPCSSEILSSKDRNWLQELTDGIGYSRVISSIALVSIPILKSIAGPSPLPITAYHGIKEEFVGKASTVHYCHNGQWVKQQITD